MFRFLFKILITLCLIVILFNFIDKTTILNNLQSLNYFQFISYLFLILISLFFLYLRFECLLDLGFSKKFPLNKRIDIFITSLGLSYVPIPGAQELYKYYDISKLSKNKELSFYIVIIERIFGLIGNLSILLLLIFIFFSKFIFTTYNFYLAIFCLCLMIVFFFILFYFSIKIINAFPYLSYAFHYLKLNILNFRIFVFKIYIYSIFLQIFSIFSSFYAISFFSSIENYLLLIFYLQIAAIIVAIPVSFFGIGLRDIVYVSIFTSQLNFNASNVASSSTFINFFTILTVISSIFILLFFRKKIRSAKKGNK